MITEHRDFQLRPYNTFGIEARAAEFIDYTDARDLSDIFPLAGVARWLHIGGGSNLLFTRDYDGLVLHSSATGVEVVAEDDETVDVRACAGLGWDDFVSMCVGRGWTGAENLSLIPGEVGASAVQNIGAYGVEACDLIRRVETFDTENRCHRTFGVGECGYSYRDSRFKHERQYIVTHVTYRLSKQFKPDLSYGNLSSIFAGQEDRLTPAALREAVIGIRRAKLPDPEVTGNAGSFFMNPVVSEDKYRQLLSVYPSMPAYKVAGGVKLPAGWLIDRCGWKGRSLGRAGVHPKQALVLVNLGGATAEDIMRLAATIEADVADKFGVAIKPEVNYI